MGKPEKLTKNAFPEPLSKTSCVPNGERTAPIRCSAAECRRPAAEGSDHSAFLPQGSHLPFRTELPKTPQLTAVQWKGIKATCPRAVPTPQLNDRSALDPRAASLQKGAPGRGRKVDLESGVWMLSGTALGGSP